MSENIVVSDELFKVGIPMEDTKDWQMVHCHKVSINEFDFLFIPVKAEWGIKINVTEEHSGCKFTELWIDPFTFLTCDTKEKTLQLFKLRAKDVEGRIKRIGRDKIANEITKRTNQMISLCGARPESEVVECLMS